MRQKTSNLAVIVNNDFVSRTETGHEKRFEITNVLQTTLILDQLLDLFSKQSQSMIPHNGYNFVNHELNLIISSGTQSTHSVDYKLVIGDETLGTITLWRRNRFKKHEIAQLEALLCCLVYPVRNALLYRKALQSARTDALTGVLNRAALTACLDREWELARRQNTALSMIMIDVDHFKSINDRHGHQIGDAVLKSIAECIKKVVRKSDIVFRYGGEEFVVILSNTAQKGAALLSERIRKTVESIDLSDIAQDLKTTASFGVASLKDDEASSELMKQVDKAMYLAKIKGRNRVSITD